MERTEVKVKPYAGVFVVAASRGKIPPPRKVCVCNTQFFEGLRCSLRKVSAEFARAGYWWGSGPRLVKLHTHQRAIVNTHSDLIIAILQLVIESICSSSLIPFQSLSWPLMPDFEVLIQPN